MKYFLLFSICISYIKVLSNRLNARPIIEFQKDYIVKTIGCGTGCKYQITQLSDPEKMKDGWIKVKVKKTLHFFSTDGKETSFRGIESGTSEVGYNFAHCKKEKFAFGSHPDRSDAISQDIFYRQGRSTGKPKIQSVAGNPFGQWKKLCDFKKSI